MKSLILSLLSVILLALTLVGCGTGHLVPKEAFKECLAKNWEIDYRSTGNGTYFRCIKPTRKGVK